MNKFGPIAILFVSFFLTDCKTKQNHQKDLDFFSLSKQTLLPGIWHYNKTIWYSADLMLNNDGGFSFLSQNCLGKILSEGKWFKQGQLIILLSADRFRPTKQNGQVCFRIHDDTAKAFFNNERLQIKNDTLFFIGQNEILNGHKFTKRFISPLSYTTP